MIQSEDWELGTARQIHAKIVHAARRLTHLDQSLLQQALVQPTPTDPLRLTTTSRENRFVPSPELRSRHRTIFRSSFSFMACYVAMHDILGIYLNRLSGDTLSLLSPIAIMTLTWSMYPWKRVELALGQVFRGGVVVR